MFTSEKAMATQTSTLAWKIPWKEDPGGLQSMGLQKTGHDWATSLSRFTFVHWRRNWQHTPVSLGNPRNGGAWWVAIYGVAQSQTRLKRLSSTSCIFCLMIIKKKKMPTAVVVVKWLGRVWLFVTPWTAACQASLSFTISQNLLKLMSIESVMPSNHLILCHPRLLRPSIFHA